MIIDYFGSILLMVVLLLIAVISYYVGDKTVAYTSLASALLYFLLLFISTPMLGTEKGLVVQSTPQVLVVEVKGFPIAAEPKPDVLVGDEATIEKQVDRKWIVTKFSRIKKPE